MSGRRQESGRGGWGGFRVPGFGLRAPESGIRTPRPGTRNPEPGTRSFPLPPPVRSSQLAVRSPETEPGTSASETYSLQPTAYSLSGSRQNESCRRSRIPSSVFRFSVALLLMLALGWTGLYAQLGNPFNERDDKYRLLGLKRAKAIFETAQRDHQRTLNLFEQKLVPRSELDRTASNLADAEVNYHQSLLAVIFEGQYVAIVSAIKYQGEDGRKHVRLTLENTSGGGAEYRRLLNIDDELFRSLQPDIVYDIYVSLLDDDNTIISSPYEAKIEELQHGRPAEIDFTLLRDLDTVTVGMSYGNGTQRSPKISLQKDASIDKVILQSEQFSQEAELGGSATFDLTLELFSGENDTFKLEVVNLPTILNRYFMDPDSQARLRQFKFTEGNNTRQAALQVFLPDRANQAISIDRPIPFFALVIPRNQALELGDMRGRQWSEEEIEALEVGYVRLELVPRGVGELLVKAPQLYYSVHPGEPIAMALDLKNEGTQRLDNIEVRADPPLNWQKTVDPALIPSLEVGEEQRVTVTVSPPAEVAVGKYEIRLQSSSLSDNQPIDGDDKTMTVEIVAQTEVTGIALVMAAIVALVLGIVVFGIRLARR